MRILNENEKATVHGGDGEDAQQIACASTFAALTGYLGMVGATAEATASGVLSIPGVSICQSTTSVIGSSLASGYSDAQEGFDALVVDVETAFLTMQSALNLGTIGL